MKQIQMQRYDITALLTSSMISFKFQRFALLLLIQNDDAPSNDDKPFSPDVNKSVEQSDEMVNIDSVVEIPVGTEDQDILAEFDDESVDVEATNPGENDKEAETGAAAVEEATNKDDEEIERSPNASNEQDHADEDNLNQENESDDAISLYGGQEDDIFGDDEGTVKRYDYNPNQKISIVKSYLSHYLHWSYMNFSFILVHVLVRLCQRSESMSVCRFQIGRKRKLKKIRNPNHKGSIQRNWNRERRSA